MAWTGVPIPFTPAEDAELKARRAAGEPYKAIHAAMPHRTVDVLRHRLRVVQDQAPKRYSRPPRPERIVRVCLRCAVTFTASGRFNRLCAPCNAFASAVVYLAPKTTGHRVAASRPPA